MITESKNNNILDYLAWRADVPFSVDPFNEVDNLVLCLLGYSDLSGAIDRDSEMTIAEIRDHYFKNHGEEKQLLQNLVPSKATHMLDPMADGARFRDVLVRNYVDIVDEDAVAQMEAMTFLLGDGTAYVCFCGTDDSITGWKENFRFSYLTQTKGQRLALQYLTDAAAGTELPLKVGGHSKGGNFAVFAATYADSEVQDQIIEVYANDAPGFREEVLASECYQRIVPKVISIVPDTSIIGQLLSHAYPDTVIKSCEKGLLQHDGFTWCVARNGFVRAEFSEASRFISQAQDDWLAKMDDDAREELVDSLFSPLEATQSRSFREMLAQRWETVEKIITSINNMPKEDQRNMRSAIHELMQSGEDTALRMVREKIDKLRTDSL